MEAWKDATAYYENDSELKDYITIFQGTDQEGFGGAALLAWERAIRAGYAGPGRSRACLSGR